MAVAASNRSLIDFRHSGGIFEVGFTDTSSSDERPTVMSRIDDLIANYQRFAYPAVVALVSRLHSECGWPSTRLRTSAGSDCTCPSLRLHRQRQVTSGREIDITDAFEQWMAAHEYRDAYFAELKLIQPEMAGFLGALVTNVREQLAKSSAPNTVVGLRRRGSALRSW